MKKGELSLVNLLKIMFIVAEDCGSMPIKHHCWSHIFWRLKKEQSKLKKPFDCLAKLRFDEPNSEPLQLHDAFDGLRSSWQLEVIIPSRRDYIESPVIESWRSIYQPEIAKMNEFINMAKVIIQEEASKNET